MAENGNPFLILYRVSYKGSMMRIFPQSDTKIPNHTFSNREYGWEIQPQGYGARVRDDIRQTDLPKSIKTPLEVGFVLMDTECRVIEITHVIHSQMDLCRFRIDQEWFPTSWASSEIKRLEIKATVMGMELDYPRQGHGDTKQQPPSED